MPRPVRKIPCVSVEVQLDLPNYQEFVRRFPSPGKIKIKFGAISDLVNKLLTRHFSENPAVTLTELEQINDPR